MPVWGSVSRFGSYGEYYKKYVNVDQKDKSIHHAFLVSLEEWIRQHNSAPHKTRPLCCIHFLFFLVPNGSNTKYLYNIFFRECFQDFEYIVVRLLDKKAVTSAKTKVETKTKVGMKIKAPPKEFILVENWDEAKFALIQDEKIADMFIDGVKKKGVVRMKGLKGHYELQEYEDQALEETTEEHDSKQHLFGNEALENKRTALRVVFQEAANERNAVALDKVQETSVDDILKLLKTLPQSSGASAASGSDGAGQEEEQDATVAPTAAEADPSEEEEEDDALPTQRLGLALGKKQPPKPKAAAKPKAVAAPVGLTLNPNPNPNQCELFAGSAEETRSNSTFALDGRGQRFKETLNKILGENEEKLLEQVRFEDDDLASAEAKKNSNAKTRAFNGILTSLSNLEKRIAKSPNKGAFEEEVRRFSGLTARVQALQKFNAELIKPTPDPTEIVSALEEIEQFPERFAVILGKATRQKLLDTKLNQCMTYRDFAAYADCLCHKSPWVAQLVSSDLKFF